MSVFDWYVGSIRSISSQRTRSRLSSMPEVVTTTSDRGVVAVLDPRLATARYGGFLKASLPPMWTTTDPSVVRKALTRLAGN